MYTCSKCGELLGDNATTCFNCKNTIQKKEVEEHIRDSERSIAQHECEIRNKYTKRLDIYIIFFIVAAIFIAFAWLLSHTEDAFVGLFLSIPALFILIILPFAFRIKFCPFCGGFLRHIFIGNHCPHCGKKYKNE